MVKIVKKYFKFILPVVICLCSAQPAEAEKKALEVGSGAHYEVTLRTSEGTVKLRLYNDTPRHRDNFVKLVGRGFYDNLLFHRVIRDFMIQCGDPESRGASQVKVYGNADAGYKLDAEIRPEYFHKRGVLAAAREGDDLNPTRQSSGSQFYIVTGKVQNDSTLTAARAKIAARGGTPLTPEQETVYRTVGGAPHLDGSYTIFGEVVSGIGVVEKISGTATDSHDRPRKDIYVRSADVQLVPDKK